MEKKERQTFVDGVVFAKRPYLRLQRFSIFLFFGLFLALGGLYSETAQAATLYFSPNSGAHSIGQSFSVGVYVSSKEQAANAVQGTVSYPADKLQLTSLSKGGSIISLWVQEPTFGAGSANFEGVVLNPGFTGNGKIVTLNFKVKAAGEAQLTFSSGSVLANDGQGTNILSGLGNASFILRSVSEPTLTAPESTSPVERAGTPVAPKVSSPTHPDPTKWYSNSAPQFEWSLPNNVTGASFLISKDSNSNPGTYSDGLVSTHTYQAVDDGIWYFHLRLRNAQGWGSITHFRFQVDTEPPRPFDIQFSQGAETENPQPEVSFYTTDELSGVDYYRIRVGDGNPIDLDASKVVKGKPYVLPAQEAGKHTLYIRVFDKAGNIKTAVAEFAVTALAPPQITEYPNELRERDILAAKGKTFPESEVTIWLQLEREDPKQQTVRSDTHGNFKFIADERVKEGVYKLWAEVVDKRGARSLPSEKIVIPVKRSPLLDIGYKTVSLLAIIIQFFALIIFIILLIWYTWHRIRALRQRIGREIKDVEIGVHQAFDILREDVRKHLKLLEKVKSKRELTVEEEKIIRQLRRDLDITEKMVNKKIEKIEEDIK